MSSTLEMVRERASGALDADAIREKFNAVVGSRPLAQVAPETGVAYSTLQAWKTNTYKGNSDKITKQVAIWLNTREATERQVSTTRAAPPFVMTRSASKIWEALEFAQSMPDMVLISQEAGWGKTTACRAYKANASNVHIMTAQPVHDSVHALLAALGRAINTDLEYRAANLSRAIETRLVGTKGLVIIDEAQFLPPLVRDQLRSTVFDAAGIGVALVGNEDLGRQFSRERLNGQNAQLFSRIGFRMRASKPSKADITTLLDAWGVDDAGARELALGIAMKPGTVRAMTKCLRLAFALADARGDEAPAAADLESAWEQLGGIA